MAHPSEAELRQMVRDLLREIMVERRSLAGIEDVRMTSDAELQAFVKKLTAPGIVEAVRDGRLRFRLVADVVQRPEAQQKPVLSGVISERKLGGCAAGETIFVARGAVLTPLARDRARHLGLKIERMSG
jgi:hypothetical protein